MKSITKQLEEEFGGKWKYIRSNFPNGHWECEEKNAHAWYVADGGYDVNGCYMPSRFPPAMYVYGLGTPERFTPEQSYVKWLKK